MNAANDDAFEAGRQAGFDGDSLEPNPHFGDGKTRACQSVEMGKGPTERGGQATIANNGEVQPLRFSTDDFPEHDRVAMWRELFGRLLVRLDIEPLPQAQFRARYILHALPGLRISSGIGGGAREWRTRELLSDGNDELALLISLKGGTVVSQRGREIVLGEQEAILASSGEVGGIVRPKPDQLLLCLRLPRAAMLPFVPDADNAIMRPIPRDAEALHLLKGYVGVLQKNRALAQSELHPLVVNHVYDLVAALIGPTRDAMEVARGRGMRAARLAAIRGDVLANLSEMRLSAKTVASRHGLTDRYVHRLFEETGQTFSQFVEEERLKRAYTLLTDSTHAAVRIGVIASYLGFGEHSTFNRAFRRRFGDTPGSVRRARSSDGQD
jgi:AraC-like DNA-binding protein